jgi:hypothetical protein
MNDFYSYASFKVSKLRKRIAPFEPEDVMQDIRLKLSGCPEDKPKNYYRRVIDHVIADALKIYKPSGVSYNETSYEHNRDSDM